MKPKHLPEDCTDALTCEGVAAHHGPWCREDPGACIDVLTCDAWGSLLEQRVEIAARQDAARRRYDRAVRVLERARGVRERARAETETVLERVLETARSTPPPKRNRWDWEDLPTLWESIHEAKPAPFNTDAFVRAHPSGIVSGTVVRHPSASLMFADNAEQEVRKMAALYERWGAEGEVRLVSMLDLPPCTRHRKPEIALACVNAAHRVGADKGEYLALPFRGTTVVVGLLGVGEPVTLGAALEVCLERLVGGGYRANSRSLSTWRQLKERNPDVVTGMHNLGTNRPLKETRDAISSEDGLLTGGSPTGFGFRLPSVDAWRRVKRKLTAPDYRGVLTPVISMHTDDPGSLVSGRAGP